MMLDELCTNLTKIAKKLEDKGEARQAKKLRDLESRVSIEGVVRTTKKPENHHVRNSAA